MPTITTTKEFIEFLYIESDSNENNKDLLDFLKKDIFDVTLICDFESDLEYQSASNENPLWEMLLDKFDRIIFKENLENKIQEDEFYSTLDEHNLFLTSLSPEKCNQLSNERGYIYISSKDISQPWEKISFLRKNSVLKVTKDCNFPNNLKFDCWSKLEKYLLPQTGIVIFDKYILCDKSNQKISDNIFELLIVLCKNNPLKKLLTVTIISEFKNDNEIINSFKKLNQFLVEKRIENVKINIIRHDKKFYPKNLDGLHYRLILTNNVRIKCDDSFNFFKPNRTINNDADLTFSFYFFKPFRSFYNKELDHLYRYIQSVKNYSEDLGLPDKVFYHMDKVNNLF